MKLKGITNYGELMEIQKEMGSEYEFLHKKGKWTLRHFSTGYNKIEELPFKTVATYETRHRRYEIKIENLYKHFEIVKREKEEE